MPNAPLPSSIKIGAKVYQIHLLETLSAEDECGHTLNEKLLIRINASLPLAEQQETLLHELLHACLHFAGMSKGGKFGEEEIISRLSPILFTVLKENTLDFLRSSTHTST